MKTVKQLSLFLENKPGTLAAVRKAHAREKINVHAISVSDAADHAVVRLLADRLFCQVLPDGLAGDVEVFQHGLTALDANDGISVVVGLATTVQVLPIGMLGRRRFRFFHVVTVERQREVHNRVGLPVPVHSANFYVIPRFWRLRHNLIDDSEAVPAFLDKRVSRAG